MLPSQPRSHGRSVLSHGSADVCVFPPADPLQPPLTGNGDITVEVCLPPGHRPFLADTGTTVVQDSSRTRDESADGSSSASLMLPPVSLEHKSK